MAISTTSRRMPVYLGDGSAKIFAFNFKVRSKEDLKAVWVKLDDYSSDTMDIGTDFTVAGVGDKNGGSITLRNDGQKWLDANGNLAAGYNLHLFGNTPRTQGTSISSQPTFYPKTHEDVFDKLTMMAQEIDEILGRAPKLPDFLTPADFDPTLPIDIGVAGASPKVLMRKANGTGWDLMANSPTLAEIAAAIAAKDQAEAAAASASASQDAGTISAAAALASQIAAAASAAAAAALIGVQTYNSTFNGTITGTLDDLNTTYLTDDTFIVGTEIVSVGVQLLTKGLHYYFDGTTLELVDPPSPDQDVTVRGKVA